MILVFVMFTWLTIVAIAVGIDVYTAYRADHSTPKPRKRKGSHRLVKG